MAYTWKKFQTEYYSKSELNAFKGLANTGIIRLQDFKDAFSKQALERMKDLKMVETKSYVVDGKNEKVVRLTRTGKKFVKVRLVPKLYKYNVRQLSHDLKLSEKYCSLNQSERNTWTHEGMMKEQYKKMGITPERMEQENIKTIDACYMNSSGQMVGVEIVTSNYSAATLQGKMNALRHFSGGSIIDNVR